MSNLEDKEILDLMLGGIRCREMTGITFLQWMSDKMNGVPTYSATTQELLGMLTHPPMSNYMPDDEKIRLIRKLQDLNIPIV